MTRTARAYSCESQVGRRTSVMLWSVVDGPQAGTDFVAADPAVARAAMGRGAVLVRYHPNDQFARRASRSEEVGMSVTSRLDDGQEYRLAIDAAPLSAESPDWHQAAIYQRSREPGWRAIAAVHWCASERRIANVVPLMGCARPSDEVLDLLAAEVA